MALVGHATGEWEKGGEGVQGGRRGKRKIQELACGGLRLTRGHDNIHMVGSLKMNTTLEYSTRVVQEGDRRCKKSTLNDLAYLTPLRIPLMNPVIYSVYRRKYTYTV